MTEERKRIVLGFNIDFTADEVTAVAIEHAQAFGARLDVVSSVVGHHLDPDGNPTRIDAQKRLARLTEQLEVAGIDFEIHMLPREKSPGRDIIGFVERIGAYEMVVGFKERSVIGEIVFGSNYRELIGEAPCPIVTVHVPG